MLCIFGKHEQAGVAKNNQSTSAAKRTEPAARGKGSDDLEDEEIDRQLEALSASLPTRMRAYVAEHTFGSTSGMAYVRSPSAAYLKEDGIHLCCSGEVAGMRSMDTAMAIMDVYKRLVEKGSERSDITENDLAASSLAHYEGRYVFVLYDEPAGRVVASRDSKGGESLFWGTALLSGKLVFSTVRSIVEDECMDVDAFPAGMFSITDLGTTTSSTSSLLVSDEPSAPSADIRQEAVYCGTSSTEDLLSSLHKVPSNGAIATK